MTWRFCNSLYTHLHSFQFYFYLLLQYGNVRIENMDGHERNIFIESAADLFWGAIQTGYSGQ